MRRGPFPGIPHPEAPPTGVFKEQIRSEWNAVAEDWGRDTWWRFVETAAQVCNDRLVELARLGAGSRVLDVGTGVGEPAATAARAVTPGGRVLGIDLAPRMIEQGRRRMERLGLANVDLQVGDAESLQLKAGTFDAVLSRWTLMLVHDLGGALEDMKKLLVPGGWLSAGLWGHPSRVPMVSLAMDTAMQLLRMPPPPEDLPTHLWTRGTDTLEELAVGAGLEEVGVETLDLVFEFPSPEVYAEFVSRMAGPLRSAANQLPEPMVARLRGALATAAEPFTRPDGSVRFVNQTLLLYGQRPHEAH